MAEIRGNGGDGYTDVDTVDILGRGARTNYSDDKLALDESLKHDRPRHQFTRADSQVGKEPKAKTSETDKSA